MIFKFEKLLKIGDIANSSLNLETVLNNILKSTLEITGASVGMIFLKDTKTNCLYWGASIGLSNTFVEDYKNKHIQLGEGLTGTIAQNGVCIYIPTDSSHDPRIARPVVKAENLNSFIGVPIYAKEEIVGVMNILTRPPEILDKNEFSVISSIGQHIGSAIQNAKLFEENINARELLKESEEKYKNLFNSAPDMYYSLDKNAIIIDCNETGLKMLGYQKEEIIGKPINDFFTKKSQELFNETFPELKIKKVLFNLEREFIRKDNTILPVSINVYSEIDKNGELIKTKTIARDITITKKIEKEKNDLIEKLTNSEKKVIESYNALEDLFLKFITAMVNALDAKSSWTKGHSENVANYSEELTNEMKLNEEEIKKIKLAALLHDIGKIAISDNILNKNGKLTEEEFNIIKKHPLIGMKILEDIKQLKDILPLIKFHHERCDGKGYPDGLNGDKIPLGAKILHVLDSFDAMTSERPYRSNPGLEYAISELKKHSGTQFETYIVEAFLKILLKNKKKQ